VLKLRMFRVGTWMPTVSRTEGQCLVPLKTFIKIIIIIIIINMKWRTGVVWWHFPYWS
jgi:hypothetical protein